MKRYLLFILPLISIKASAQQTINVASNSVKINGMNFDYSIGEMTLVNTIKNTNLIVTQGFLQPEFNSSMNDGNSTEATLNTFEDQLNLYPNPTNNILNIDFNESRIIQYNYQLLDGLGKIIFSNAAITNIGFNTIKIDMHSYAAGTYFIIVTKPSNSNCISVTLPLHKLAM
jgi:hypothetical protein